MPINLYTLCESKHRTIRAVTLWVRAHVVGEGGECSGRHIKFPTLMVHLGEQCLSWTPCFLSKQSLLLSLSSQVFVPVAGSQAFVPYLLPLCTPRRPACTRASDRSVTSIAQHAVSSTIGSRTRVGTFPDFIMRKSWQRHCLYLVLK